MDRFVFDCGPHDSISPMSAVKGGYQGNSAIISNLFFTACLEQQKPVIASFAPDGTMQIHRKQALAGCPLLPARTTVHYFQRQSTDLYSTEIILRQERYRYEP